MDPAPQPPLPSQEELQFEQAEFAGPPSICAACKRGIGESYFLSGGATICAACAATRRQAEDPQAGAQRFGRAVLYGIPAAMAGSAIYYAILALTGYEVGLVALVVGLMVGAAVRVGCFGRGGWRYQLLAIVLTYVAVVSTYVPTILEGIDGPAPDGVEATAVVEVGGVPEEVPMASAPSEAPLPRIIAIPIAIVLALFAPLFLLMEGEILSLIIIGIALYEAWRINKRTSADLTGPYPVAAMAPVAVPVSSAPPTDP